jgi:hypothetical protein
MAEPRPTWSTIRTAGAGHFRRAFRRDLSSGVADAEERAFLSTPSPSGRRAVTGTKAQDYLAWRRSMLWTTATLLAAASAAALVDFLVALAKTDDDVRQFFDAGTFHFLQFLQLAAGIFLAVAAARGAARWDEHRLVRWGWIVGFLVPFATALVPVSSLFRFEAPATAEAAAQQTQALQAVGLVFGLLLFLGLVPSVLAVFLGAIRASLTLEQIVPESSLPGWVATVAAPVFGLVAIAVFVLFHQIGGSFILLAGVGLIVANYVLLARDGPRLARPQTAEEAMALLRPIWARSRVLLGLGSLAVVVALFTLDFFGFALVGFTDRSMMSPFKVLELGISVAGRSLFTMVLFCDLLLALLHHTWVESRNAPPALSNPLDQRLAELADAGIGSLRPPPPPPAAPPA